MAGEEMDLRKLYFPSVNILFNRPTDLICQVIFSKLYSEYQRKTGQTSINISASDFDAIFNNSVSMSELITSGNLIKLEKLQTRLDNKLAPTRIMIDSDDTIPSFPIQFISPNWRGHELTWSKLFQNFTQIRISNIFSYGGKNIKAVSFGRPNHEVHSDMLNSGGCGLSALAALGIIGMDEYCIAVTNEKFLNSDVGTLGTTLYKLMLSDFFREYGILPQNTTLCARRFLIDGIPTRVRGDAQRFKNQINDMRLQMWDGYGFGINSSTLRYTNTGGNCRTKLLSSIRTLPVGRKAGFSVPLCDAKSTSDFGQRF
jgi:hypothetical protein